MVTAENKDLGIIAALAEAALQGQLWRPDGANIVTCALVTGKDEKEHFFADFSGSMSEALDTLEGLRDGEHGPIIWAAINHLGRTRYHLEDGDIVQDYQE